MAQIPNSKLNEQRTNSLLKSIKLSLISELHEGGENGKYKNAETNETIKICEERVFLYLCIFKINSKE